MKNHSMSNFEVRSLLLFSALVMGPALAAHAQQATPAAWSAQPASVKPDAIATQAALGQAQAAFSRADTNGDGKLSRQEAEHFPAMAPHFKLIDTDHDNALSFDELIRGASDGT